MDSLYTYVPDSDQLSTSSSAAAPRLDGLSQGSTREFTSPESGRPQSRGTGTRRAHKLRRVVHHVSPSHSGTHRSHTSVGTSQADGSAWDRLHKHTILCNTQEERDLCLFLLGNMRQLDEGWKEGLRKTVQKCTLQYCGEKLGATPPHQPAPPPPSPLIGGHRAAAPLHPRPHSYHLQCRREWTLSPHLHPHSRPLTECLPPQHPHDHHWG